jgi:tRNA nucleotidyltransferase (CCA-adding enzyme)
MMFSKIKADILKEIVPSDKEKKEITSLTNTIVSHLTEKISKTNLKARVEVVGSIAKDTWISRDRDLDIFIVFDISTPLEELKKMGLALGKIELM